MNITINYDDLDLNEHQKIDFMNVSAAFKNGMRCFYHISGGDYIIAARIASQHFIDALEMVGVFD